MSGGLVLWPFFFLKSIPVLRKKLVYILNSEVEWSKIEKVIYFGLCILSDRISIPDVLYELLFYRLQTWKFYLLSLTPVGIFLRVNGELCEYLIPVYSIQKFSMVYCRNIK